MAAQERRAPSHGRAGDPYLSLIVPFHDSATSSAPLLARLREVCDARVQLVFVDDGSTDGTRAALEAFAASHPSLDVELVFQPNAGPGAARNAGLARARGAHVWFVDSDDLVTAAAVTFVRDLGEHAWDFIDFDLSMQPARTTIGSAIDSMGLPARDYVVGVDLARERLMGHGGSGTGFGRLWTKVFSRSFLTRVGFAYPEHCLYEDNAVSMWLPFLVSRFRKVDVTGYVHVLEHDSVTRGGEPYAARTYDRLHTAVLGYRRTVGYCATETERRQLDERFAALFVGHTVFHGLRARPLRALLHGGRVLRYYREVSAALGIGTSGFDLPHGGLGRIVFRAMDGVARLLPSQAGYFAEMRRRAWGRPLSWPGFDGAADVLRPERG
jgi:glycosyltransferase involved in cell wall biosynthesis